MLNNNKKIFIYNLCSALSKLYTNIQQDQEAKLDYQCQCCLRIWRAGREWEVRGFKIFYQRGSEFFLLALCVCVWWGGGGGGGGGESGSVPLLP